MRSRKLSCKIASVITLLIFTFSSMVTPVFAGIESSRQTYAAPGFIDPFGPLDPGGWGQMRPPADNMAGLAGSLAPQSVPLDVKSLNGLGDNQDHVSAASGSVNLQVTDLTVPGRQLPLPMTRVYNTGSDQSGPMGYNWTFSYHQYLQMFEDFKIVEYRGNGNNQLYNYTKNDPEGQVDSCDGDPLIYYDLDDGYYTPAAPGNTGTLTRHSGSNYTVKTEEGVTYFYEGYKAAWRSQSADAGKLTAIEDRKGNRLSLAYDSSGNLKNVQDPYGRKLTFTYQNGLLTSVTDPVGRTVSYTYDGNKDLVQVTGPDGATQTYTYDGSHRLTGITDALGNTIAYSYNSEGKVTQSVQSGGIAERTYSYPGEQKTVVEDPDGNATTYEYDDKQNITRMEDALHNVTSCTWDSAGNRTSVTLPDGNKTEYSYDSKNNLVKITAFDGSETRFEYSSAYSQLTKAIYPSGTATECNYDSNGNLTSVRNGLNQTTSYSYDNMGNMTRITDPAGKKTSIQYDQYGNIKEITNPLDQKTTYVYDAVGRMLSFTLPGDRTTVFSYDQGKLPVSVTDHAGLTTTYQYNKMNQPVKITGSMNNTTSLGYNLQGRLTRVTDPTAKITSIPMTTWAGSNQPGTPWGTRLTLNTTLSDRLSREPITPAAPLHMNTMKTVIPK